MILSEITPISPIAEHIMVMANETFPADYIKEVKQLRKLLAKYKKVGSKNRIQPHKSYIKIIKDDRAEVVIIRGPRDIRRDLYECVYVYPCLSIPSLRLSRTCDSPIKNTSDTRLFFDIYEIPDELCYELTTLTEQWLKRSTTN